MTADLDTRCGELYAQGGEVLPVGDGDADRAGQGADGEERSEDDSAGRSGFSGSREQFESLIGFLDGTVAAGLSHAELEERVVNRPGVVGDFWPWKQGRSYAHRSWSGKAEEQAVLG